MNSSPVSDREYAYFRAVGIFNPVDASRFIGLAPSESWAAEDEFTLRGHTRKRQNSCWIWNSGLNDSEPLSRHVDVLLQELSPRRSGLLETSSIAKLQIVCVGFYAQSFSWELDTQQMRIASALNIGFWFDTYSLNDPHEEIVSLREQTGIRRDAESG